MRKSINQPMSTKNKESSSAAGILTTIITIVVVVVAARACGSIVGENAAKKHFKERENESYNSKSEAETVETTLRRLVNSASLDLPKMVDRITRLESVVFENGNTIVESYTITTMTKDEFDILELNSELNKKIQSDFTSDPETKILRDNNVVWVRKYYDKNGELITTVSSST